MTARTPRTLRIKQHPLGAGIAIFWPSRRVHCPRVPLAGCHPAAPQERKAGLRSPELLAKRFFSIYLKRKWSFSPSNERVRKQVARATSPLPTRGLPPLFGFRQGSSWTGLTSLMLPGTERGKIPKKGENAAATSSPKTHPPGRGAPSPTPFPAHEHRRVTSKGRRFRRGPGRSTEPRNNLWLSQENARQATEP